MDWKALGKAVATVAAIGAIAWTIVVAEHLFGGALVQWSLPLS